MPQQQMPQQQMPQQQAAQQQQFSVEQINQLVAPIALYPDNLLGQVLAASTYPLEIVVAARWAQSNKNVTGQALEEAMQLQGWDASVKALCAVPQVLVMMSEKLEWTQQLGAAYLAQPDDIAVAVQNLRARADASGNLKETNQVKVRRVAAPPPPEVYLEPPPPEYIYIEPYDPAYLVVPVYDPWVAYGVWPWPFYRPWYYVPYGYVGVGIIGYGAPIFVGSAIWASYHWGSRSVVVNVNKYNSFNRTRIASTGGGTMKWQQNSQFAKASANFKPGAGGPKPGNQQFQTRSATSNVGTKTATGNVGTSGSQRQTNFNQNGPKPGVQTFQSKSQGATGIKPQGIASVNPGGGPKPTPKVNTGTIKTNVGATQRMNVGAMRQTTFRAPPPRVNVQQHRR